ncbi:hypothetical protein [Leucobacter chironomi]|uniref:hypothetical protein n=1 Tax=Leucobacter chironomi TaxID=491918 RepID=UPI00040AC6FE|nr:hypothetical protein [Leucobacter chironomi]
MTRWHDAESAADAWEDAPDDDERLEELLAVARAQVVAYSPHRKADPAVAADSDDVPVEYRLAQLRQAQNLWAAGSVSTDGGMGDGDSFTLTPHPLDWHVKQIIRPRGGRPRVR